MLYYSVTGKPAETARPFVCGSPLSEKEQYVFGSGICMKSSEFNRTLSKNGAFLFFVRIREDSVLFDAISPEAVSPDDIDEYLAYMEFPLEEIRCREIIITELLDHLRYAEVSSFIRSDSEVLSRFGLGNLSRFMTRTGYCSQFQERILEDVSPDTEKDSWEQKMVDANLAEEVARIEQGPRGASGIEGHPVHYIYNYSGPNPERSLIPTLLRSLYDNGRIKSRRYAEMHKYRRANLQMSAHSAAYRSMAGGAFVITLSDFDDELFNSESTDESLAELDFLCETIKKYRNEVLTVLCFPRSCVELKKYCSSLLDDIAFIEIEEELVDAEKAAGLLKELAQAKKMKPDKALYSAVKEGEFYLPSDLHQVFSRWFDAKLRKTVYPQYADVKTLQRSAVEAKPRGSAYEQLMSLIGLTEAKAVIRKVLDYHRFRTVYGSRTADRERPSMHMVFSGSPGTAKTTVARLFAQIMKDNGFLSSGVMVEVGRSDLVGKYVGWTANVVQEAFRKAKGGVLFIDEAYSLVDDRSGSFGDEAINTIVQEMENQRDDTVVIFAGYRDRMEEFLNKNPGLRSRIPWNVPFPDYSTDELTQIADLIARGKGLTISNEAREKIHVVSEAARLSKQFGNGRYVRTLVEQAKMNLCSRVMRMNPDEVDSVSLTTILADDITSPVFEAPAGEAARIGFLP